MIETKRLANYVLDIVPVEEFRSYLDDNESFFNTSAMNAYLKAVDIPPKFFREQPEETQKELLDNREIFVKENKKYFDKVIVVVVHESDVNNAISRRILGASRISQSDANNRFQQLESIDLIPNKFEHRSFIKDGYISLIISNGIEKGRDNKVIAIDFPISLTKLPVIHEALYTLPDESFATVIEHVQYLSNDEVNLGADYNNIKEAIEDKYSYLEDAIEVVEDKDILREVDLVALALTELGVIPKSYQIKIATYIQDNLKDGLLTTRKLEKLVLDYDETFKSYKQVTSLRNISGNKVLEFLDSPKFQEFVSEVEKEMELALA